jgi:triosephosphate isomerase
MSRTPLIAGNWKLHRTVSESVELARAVLRRLERTSSTEVVVAPVFTALHAVHEALGEAPHVGLAAQDVYWEDQGAYTGEVSAPLLEDVGCSHVIVGHSERRTLFGEEDDQVRRKVGALLTHGLVPIVCIGETLAQREAGETEQVVLGQLDAAVEGLGAEALRRVAIGTGRTAKAADAQAVHAAIRARLAARFDAACADRVRILYGGSVKPDNAAELLGQPDIDGALVGGASLNADSFLAIVAAAG